MSPEINHEQLKFQKCHGRLPVLLPTFKQSGSCHTQSFNKKKKTEINGCLDQSES